MRFFLSNLENLAQFGSLKGFKGSLFKTAGFKWGEIYLIEGNKVKWQYPVKIRMQNDKKNAPKLRENAFDNENIAS
jgi:hypothetical protein